MTTAATHEHAQQQIALHLVRIFLFLYCITFLILLLFSFYSKDRFLQLLLPDNPAENELQLNLRRVQIATEINRNELKSQ